jgi:hypothetical protein
MLCNIDNDETGRGESPLLVNLSPSGVRGSSLSSCLSDSAYELNKRVRLSRLPATIQFFVF